MQFRPSLWTALIWPTFAASPSEELVGKATHIFVMTRDHKRLIELLFPEAAEKTYLLREFEPGAPVGVPDPIAAWPRKRPNDVATSSKGSAGAFAL